MNKTVIILGAGASRASKFQLPTMEGFFGHSVDELAYNLRELLTWFYPNKKPNQYNLEEVLSYLFTCYTRQPSLSREISETTSRAKYAYHDLLDFVAQRLGITENDRCDLHVKLFESLNRKDTILTVNYDLVADRSLRYVERNKGVNDPKDFRDLQKMSRMSKCLALLGQPDFMAGSPPALIPEEKEWGFYIKLHGSLDWIWCANHNCLNSSRFHCLGIERFKEGQEPQKPCRLCGTPLQAFLVPPVASKVIEPQGRLAFLWNLALQELTNADRLVIFGISFAPSDQEIRWLIRQSNALRQGPVEVCIINPNQNDRETAKGLFPQDSLVREFDRLEEYLQITSEEVRDDTSSEP